MTDFLETVKTLETRPKAARKVKQVRMTTEEKEMLAKLAETFGVDESEVIRRLIRVSYDSLEK